MRLKVYNPGGFNRKCIYDWFDNSIILRCTHYSAADKLKIVAAVDKMMAKETSFRTRRVRSYRYVTTRF